VFVNCIRASLFGSLLALPAAAEEGNRVSALRGMLDKWVDVQKAISKEKSDAGNAKQLLTQRTELLTREVEDLRKKKVESEAGITEADAKKAELVTKKESIAQSLAGLEKELPAFEAEMRVLQPLLPDPVKEKLAPLFGRIPEPDKAAKVSLAERFQNIVGILNEVNKANLEINLVSEIRPLDGKPTEVKTLYVGLGQAYFVNATGKLAGVGRPGSTGWVWEQQDGLAKDIRGAIGMLQSKSAAKFISVPVRVD
jgi:hypothetical protein